MSFMCHHYACLMTLLSSSVHILSLLLLYHFHDLYFIQVSLSIYFEFFSFINCPVTFIFIASLCVFDAFYNTQGIFYIKDPFVPFWCEMSMGLFWTTHHMLMNSIILNCEIMLFYYLDKNCSLNGYAFGIMMDWNFVSRVLTVCLQMTEFKVYCFILWN